MSKGFKATVVVACWGVLLVALAPGALAQGLCDASNLGGPCKTKGGFDGTCTPDTWSRSNYSCFEPVCVNPPPFGQCDICGFQGTCANLFFGDGDSDMHCEVRLPGNVFLTAGMPCGTAGTCLASGVCQEFGNATSDPLMTGFDGKSFHFDQTGDFTLLSSGDGFRVDVTITGAATDTKEETSWTSSVRFIAPNGDMVACALPAILPNTSKVQVTAMPASSPAQVTLLSSSGPSAEVAEMKATAVLGEDGQVGGCEVTTTGMHITVYQVSGYKQALLHPEEGWAAPYTWLNTDVKLKKPLPAPVTGVLGATYPVRIDSEAAFLRALEDSRGGLEAAVVGESGLRRLAGSTAPFFLIPQLLGLPGHMTIDSIGLMEIVVVSPALLLTIDNTI